MKLISIQVPSNKPKHFRRLVDNLWSTAADPTCFEVVVKIDTHDTAMHEAVEAIRRDLPKLNMTVVVSPPPQSYFHVWTTMDDILNASDPEYYFCWHINDEVLLETPHWDKVLEKYIGFFPDHLFRLKISTCKFYNFYQIYDTCWGGDYPIVPRRWLDVSGNWCDFHGADSYQEGIGFYLGRYARMHRNVPILDFIVGGDPPGENMSAEAQEARSRGILKHWDQGMRHAYQEDFYRRARRIELAALAHAQGITDFELRDDKVLRLVSLYDRARDQVVAVRTFRRSKLAVWFEHFLVVVDRDSGDNLIDKPAWFAALYYAARGLKKMIMLVRAAYRIIDFTVRTIGCLLFDRRDEAPLVRLVSLVREGGVPLEQIIPTVLVRPLQLSARLFPRFGAAFERVYREGFKALK